MVRGRRVVEDTVDGLVVSNHVPQAGFCKRKRSPSESWRPQIWMRWKWMAFFVLGLCGVPPDGNEGRPRCSRMKRSSMNMMRGLVLLPTLWLLLVIAQHGEARLVQNLFYDAAARKPVPCTWVCGTGNHIYECHCVPIPPQQQDDRFSLQSEPVTTDATAAALAVPDSAGRVFGIPGTLLGDTILQTGPGTSAGVITTLFQGTSVQVMCRKSDVPVNGDPWWVKVHVWPTGQEGWVPDWWVQCSHSGIGNCQVPFCV